MTFISDVADATNGADCAANDACPEEAGQFPKFPLYPENIPAELKNLRRWTVYRLAPPEKPGGKPRKIPYTPCTRFKASCTDPATWGSFEEARADYSSNPDTHGVNFVVGDGYGGFDGDYPVPVELTHGLDKPLWEDPLFDAAVCLDSYTEISPGGRLRIIFKGSVPRSGKGRDDKALEVYGDPNTGRFLSITGNRLDAGRPFIDVPRSDLFPEFWDKYFALLEEIKPQKGKPDDAETGNSLTDSELLEKAFAAKNGEKFRDLWNGDWKKHYPPPKKSQSEADEGLCTMLAFWTAKESARMDSLFRESGLYRKKWDEKRGKLTYGEITIANAIALCKSIYEDREEPEPDDFFNQSASSLPTDFKLLSVSDLLATPPLRWRVKNVLPEKGLTSIYGLSGTAKTFIVLSLTAAIAEGSKWFGHRVFPAPVLYCALEGEGGIRNRVQAHLQHFGTLGNSARFLTVPFNLLTTDVDRLAAAITAEQGKGGVVFIDTLNRAAPGADENSPDGMGAIIAGATALQRLIDGLVVLVHHTGKDTSRGLRGHYSLFAALDAAIEVQRGTDSRSWKVAKAKDNEDGQEFPFKLDVVEIGFDDDGDPITSCVVREVPGSTRRVPTAKLQRQVFDAIDSLRPLGPVTADVVINCVTPLIAFDPAKRDRRRDAITRAINDLISGGFITLSEGVIL